MKTVENKMATTKIYDKEEEIRKGGKYIEHRKRLKDVQVIE
jgi:hypothetical protein